MVLLATLIHLPKKVLLIGGLIMVFGHNLLDGIQPESFGSLSALWKVLHVESMIPLENFTIYVVYPVVPWIGVMTLGYLFADFYKLDSKVRQKRMLWLGVLLTALFIIIRGINSYGDMHPWSQQPTFGLTIASFLNTTKYPPSLVYLLMTIGPSIILLVVFEKISGPVSKFLIVFGRVPMFYYVLHLYLIHTISVILGLYQGFTFDEMTVLFLNLPPEFGFGLPITYLLWILVVAILFPLCLWYMNLKKRKKHPIFSYI